MPKRVPSSFENVVIKSVRTEASNPFLDGFLFMPPFQSLGLASHSIFPQNLVGYGMGSPESTRMVFWTCQDVKLLTKASCSAGSWDLEIRTLRRCGNSFPRGEPEDSPQCELTVACSRYSRHADATSSPFDGGSFVFWESPGQRSSEVLTLLLWLGTPKLWIWPRSRTNGPCSIETHRLWSSHRCFVNNHLRAEGEAQTKSNRRTGTSLCCWDRCSAVGNSCRCWHHGLQMKPAGKAACGWPHGMALVFIQSSP